MNKGILAVVAIILIVAVIGLGIYLMNDNVITLSNTTYNATIFQNGTAFNLSTNQYVIKEIAIPSYPNSSIEGASLIGAYNSTDNVTFFIFEPLNDNSTVVQQNNVSSAMDILSNSSYLGGYSGRTQPLSFNGTGLGENATYYMGFYYNGSSNTTVEILSNVSIIIAH